MPQHGRESHGCLLQLSWSFRLIQEVSISGSQVLSPEYVLPNSLLANSFCAYINLSEIWLLATWIINVYSLSLYSLTLFATQQVTRRCYGFRRLPKGLICLFISVWIVIPTSGYRFISLLQPTELYTCGMWARLSGMWATRRRNLSGTKGIFTVVKLHHSVLMDTWHYEFVKTQRTEWTPV